MEEKRQRGRYCVAGTPNQQSCQNRSFTPGIRMYQFPADPAVRARWVQFVRRHRHDFKNLTSKYTSLCSAHFEDSCYECSLSVLSSMEAARMKVKYCLKRTRSQRGILLLHQVKKNLESEVNALAISLQQRYSSEPTKFSTLHSVHWHLKI